MKSRKSWFISRKYWAQDKNILPHYGHTQKKRYTAQYVLVYWKWWWKHSMGTLVDSPHKGPARQSVDSVFDVSLNKMLQTKQVGGDLKCPDTYVTSLWYQTPHTPFTDCWTLQKTLCFHCPAVVPEVFYLVYNAWADSSNTTGTVVSIFVTTCKVCVYQVL